MKSIIKFAAMFCMCSLLSGCQLFTREKTDELWNLNEFVVIESRMDSDDDVIIYKYNIRQLNSGNNTFWIRETTCAYNIGDTLKLYK